MSTNSPQSSLNSSVNHKTKPYRPTKQLVGNLLFRTLVPSAFAYISRDRHMEITIPLVIFAIIPWAIQDFRQLKSHLCTQERCKNQNINSNIPGTKKNKDILEHFISKDVFLQTTSVIAGFYSCYPVTDLFIEPKWLVGKPKPSSLIEKIAKDYTNNPLKHINFQSAKDYLSYFGLSFFVFWALKDNAIAPTIGKYITPLFFEPTKAKKSSADKPKENRNG